MNIYYKITDANSITVYFTVGVYLINDRVMNMRLNPMFIGILPNIKLYGVSRTHRVMYMYPKLSTMLSADFLVPLSCEEVKDIVKKYEYLL